MGDCRLILGDALDVLRTLESESVDAVVTDPPYGLEFMGKEWDSFRTNGQQWSTTKAMTGGKDWKGDARKRQAQAYPRSQVKKCKACGRQKFSGSPCRCEEPDWAEVASFPRQLHAFQEWNERWAAATLRVVKPGGVLLAFGGTRTWHRLACALEDAGWVLRDTLMWLHGQGFPKSKACLKPGWEPILLCRKPGPLWLGVGECRVGTETVRNSGDLSRMNGRRHREGTRPRNYSEGVVPEASERTGRYPANLVLDDEEASRLLDEQAGERGGGYGDSGGPSRFFYCAKAGRKDRGAGNKHPTVKSTVLMSWLVKLACPEGGLVLDPFMGSGTTGVACPQTGRRFIGVEKEPAYYEVARRRCAAAGKAAAVPA